MTRQTDFRAAILDAELAAPPGLLDGLGRPSPRRFNVYRNNVAVSLSEALETAFPAVARLLGEDNFRAIAGRFLRLSPPDSPLMMQYGAAFPDFLAGIEALASMGYLPDIARVEQALRLSYHAADHTPLPPDALAEVAPEALPNLRFTLAPCVQLLTSNWPIHDIYRYALTPDAPKPRATPQDILISRAGFDPAPQLLPAGGAPFLHALMDGETLGNAAASASEHTPDFDLSTCLSLLLSAQAITSLKT
ncbi:MAG: DUF2063 domain-containing protein [Rhodobacteraceae bacterium]|nr:DUF2063 domain-containing protein [Paracoccaceae bacterium]